MNYVYGANASARALAKALDWRYRKKGEPPTPRQVGDGNVLCYGAAAPGYIPTPLVLNRRIVFDKLEQLNAMANEGVAVPNFAFLYTRNHVGYNTDPRPTGRPNTHWLARLRKHQHGNDVIGPLNTNDMRRELLSGHREFATEFIPKTHEWRLHVFRGEVLRIARKIPNDPNAVVWNQANSHYRYYVGLKDTTIRRLQELARSALESLRMDFGAVDIIRTGETPNQHQYFVLEVNSAPGIKDNANTLNAYKEAVERWATN